MPSCPSCRSAGRPTKISPPAPASNRSRSVAQALIQAERYGTPVAHALRVLANESRDMRMNAAEKKAAALPPKLTVPMILFFLPVLFAVILGPAGIQVSERGIFGRVRPEIERRSKLNRSATARDAIGCRIAERACLGERPARACGTRLPASVGLGLRLVAVLELLPGVLLRQHRAEIGDIGLRLLGRQLLAGDLFGFVEAALQADDQRQVLADAAVGARLLRRPSAYRFRPSAGRLRARRTCRDWRAPRARSASARAPCGRGRAPRSAWPSWSRMAPSADTSFQSGYSGVCARRTASSAGSNWPAPASALP